MQLIFHGVGLYGPGSRIGPAVWPHYDVIVAFKGVVRLIVEEETFIAEEGDAVVIPPHQRFHGFAESETATIWVAHFEGYQGQRAASPFGGSSKAFFIRQACGNRVVRLLMEELTKNWKAQSDTCPPSREAALLGELLLVRFENALSQPQGSKPPRLRAAVEETLNGNLHYDVSRMAQLAGVCSSRFRQLFVKHYGMSPVKFLQQARMDEAKRLLTETAHPIKEIGRLTGYGELAAFHHAFCREVQMTPGAYRKRYGGVV